MKIDPRKSNERNFDHKYLLLLPFNLFLHHPLYLFTFILIPSSLLLLPLPSIPGLYQPLPIPPPLFIYIPSSLLLLPLPSIPGLYQPLPTPPPLFIYIHSNSIISPPTSPALYPCLYQPLPTPPPLFIYIHSNSAISPPTSPALYPWSLSTSSYTTPSIYSHSFYFHHLSSYFPCPLSLVFINLFLHHPLYLFTFILIPPSLLLLPQPSIPGLYQPLPLPPPLFTSSLLLLPLPSIPGLYQPLPTPPPLFIYIHSNSTISPPTSPALYPWSLSNSSYSTTSIYLRSF